MTDYSECYMLRPGKYPCGCQDEPVTPTPAPAPFLFKKEDFPPLPDEQRIEDLDTEAQTLRESTRPLRDRIKELERQLERMHRIIDALTEDRE